MTYLRDLFDRYRHGDAVAKALSQAISAVDPGLQLTFVFSAEDAAALQAGKLSDTAEPTGLQIRISPRSTGIQHPGVVSAHLRAIAGELDDLMLNATAAEADRLAKARMAAAQTASDAPAATPAPVEAAQEPPAAG